MAMKFSTRATLVVAPGDDVGADHGAEFLRLHDAGELHEIPDGVNSRFTTPLHRTADEGRGRGEHGTAPTSGGQSEPSEQQLYGLQLLPIRLGYAKVVEYKIGN